MGESSSVGHVAVLDKIAASPNQVGIGIGLLFKLIQESVRQSQPMERPEYREQRAVAAEAEYNRELNAQQYQLNRMRAQSGSQMQMMLADRGVSSMLTSSGMGGPVMSSAHIMAAARSPYGRMR